jgi:hypothetical protein
LRLNHCLRWQISFEDFANSGILDPAELEAETNDNTHDKKDDKNFECAQRTHGHSSWVIEEQDD